MNGWWEGAGKEIREFFGLPCSLARDQVSLAMRQKRMSERGVKSEEGMLSRSRKFSVKVSRQLRIHDQ
jgi:hypothetical protein